MRSELTEEFLDCFGQLPTRIQRLARKNYKLWKADPYHPSLEFKRVSTKYPTYSVRIGIGWRAMGIRLDEKIVWFWIGSHANYDKMLQQF